MAKVMFSDKELIMMGDANLMPAKHLIFEKTEALFAEIGNRVIADLNFKSSSTMICKTTRGENLQGQPYLVLDIPQIKTLSNICHYRILYWWGNHVRHTILLSEIKNEAGVLNYIRNNFAGWTILNSENIWEYNPEENVPVTSYDFNDLLSQYQKTGYLRIDRTYPIESLNNTSAYESSLALYKNIYNLYHGLN